MQKKKKKKFNIFFHNIVFSINFSLLQPDHDYHKNYNKYIIVKKNSQTGTNNIKHAERETIFINNFIIQSSNNWTIDTVFHIIYNCFHPTFMCYLFPVHVYKKYLSKLKENSKSYLAFIVKETFSYTTMLARYMHSGLSIFFISSYSKLQNGQMKMEDMCPY